MTVSPLPLWLICSVRITKHVWLRVGRIEKRKAQRLELSQHVWEHKERMPFSSSLVLVHMRRECLSFHLRRTCLSLQLVVCICSVVHRTVLHFCTHSLRWRTNRTHMWTHMWLKIPRLCRPHKISPIAMSSMFAPAQFSCSHSTPLTLTSSSSIPSSRTTSQVTLPINKHCAAPPNEESGLLAQN